MTAERPRHPRWKKRKRRQTENKMFERRIVKYTNNLTEARYPTPSFWHAIDNKYRLIRPTSLWAIVITSVCLLVGSDGSLVGSYVCSSWFFENYKYDFHEIWHRCSAAYKYDNVNLWEVKVKVQGQNRRTEVLQVQIVIARSWFEISSANLAAR